MIRLMEEGYEGEFEKHVREKQSYESRVTKELQQKVEEEKRKLRCTMSIQELLQSEVYNAATEAKK